MNKLTIEEVLEKEGKYIGPAVGTSMEPLLHDRQNTIVVEKTNKELSKYDVPLYRRPIDDQYVLHRIIKVDHKKKEYVIVGDNLWCKEHIPFSCILGVLVGYFEGDKYISTSDESYIKYSHRIVRRYPIRLFKGLSKAAIRKIFRKR